MSAEIAGYVGGDANTAEINEKIAEVWTEILRDPEATAQAARLLGISPGELAARAPAAPFVAKTGQSGLDPVSVTILLFIGGMAADIVKDVVKDEAEKALGALWRKFVKPRVENKFGTAHPFGREMSDDDLAGG